MAACIRMYGIKQVLLVAGSVVALIIVAYAALVLLSFSSFISLIGFFVVAPVFLILGLGFFRTARQAYQAQQRNDR